MKKPTSGRPTKLTEETVLKLCESARLGMKVEHMCQRAGISTRAYYSWKAKAKRKEQPYYQFMQRVEKALSDGIAHNLAIILKSAKDGNWTSSAWLLERCFGYNKVIDPVDEDIAIEVDEISTKELLEAVAKSNEELKKFFMPDIKE